MSAGQFDQRDSEGDPSDGREETESERSDRNWAEILQELRVTQTGTQIISGFLLTVVFQQRFKEASSAELALYVALVILAGITTALGLAPVSLHRALFGHHQKSDVVGVANRYLMGVLICVSLLTSGVVALVVTFAIGWAPGVLSGAALFTVLALVLVVVPRRLRHQR